jgi:O-methyltransferase
MRFGARSSLGRGDGRCRDDTLRSRAERSRVFLRSNPGRRIRKLPRPLQPPVVFLRNLVQWAIGFHQPTPTDLEVYRKLEGGVEYVCANAVEGDLGEFGTMTGLSASVLARALAGEQAYRGGDRTLHLFDSFEGLPEAVAEADRKAPLVQAGIWAAGTCRGVSPAELRDMCARFLPASRIAIHAGWFSQTLLALPPNTRFALLHVDCDLYQSALDVLMHVFSRGLVAEGAAVFFDDWNCNRASRELGERRAWAEAVERFDILYTDSGEYGTAGRKFLVHSYRTGPEGASGRS